MKGRKSKSWAMAYCGMAAALSVALMLLGAVFPIAMFIAPAVASFLIATVCVECGKTMALTAYGAVSLLSLLFVPDKEVALTFVFLLGYYPLVKPRFERIRLPLVRALCKLLLCNGAVLAMYGLVLLLAALNFGFVKLDDVKEVGIYLTGIFPLLFVPAAAGVMELWAEMGNMLLPIIIAIIPVTVLVMVSAGRTTQAMTGRKKKEADHAE